jgi:hypothetical protein
VALLLTLAIGATLAAPGDVWAKRGGDKDRERFYGWVESMPEGLHGTWIIGGQEVTTSPQTQFDETDGPLRTGGCAKVDIRGGVVHEIDSEPPSDCR